MDVGRVKVENAFDLALAGPGSYAGYFPLAPGPNPIFGRLPKLKLANPFLLRISFV